MNAVTSFDFFLIKEKCCLLILIARSKVIDNCEECVFVDCVLSLKTVPPNNICGESEQEATVSWNSLLIHIKLKGNFSSYLFFTLAS